MSLVSQVSDLKEHGRKFDKAVDTVLAGGVKECRFLPSGRALHTVVGTLGDEFIDPARPYCSCGHFFFRVKGGQDTTCYHLLSYAIASRTNRIDVINFDDEEYGPYFGAVVRDVFEVIDRSSEF